jgi:hypothetical protein
LFLSSLLAPKLVKISNPLKIILKTRIGLIYSFKVLFFLGSVAGVCLSSRHLFNLSILSISVKGFAKYFWEGVKSGGDFRLKTLYGKG